MSTPRSQSGVALLGLLALVLLSATWLFLRDINSASAERTATKRLRNAAVLSQAKAALIGHVAMQASKAGEHDPGRLPCPEPASTTGTALEGATASSCALAVGRFPWRTIGTEKLVDAEGESLWLVVSNGWVKNSSTSYLTINSNSRGQLNVDGQANAAVALIIAPGAPMNALAAPGCAARDQRLTRSAPSPSIDVRDYLECLNTATATYATTGAEDAFNDQVVKITASDVLHAIEAAIANRIEREIVPVIKDTYLAPSWFLSGSNRWFPSAAAFDDAANFNYLGTPALREGLLPFNYSEACTPATEPRCAPATWTPTPAYYNGGFGYIQAQTCGFDGTAYQCIGEYREDSANPAGAGMRIRMDITVSNVSMGFRLLDARIEARDDFLLGPWQTQTLTTRTVTLNANGSATISIAATLPNIDAQGWGTYASYKVRFSVSDHWVLYPMAREMDFSFVSGADDGIYPGQTITGQSSGATARVAAIDKTGTWGLSATGSLIVYGVSGTFSSGENLRVGGTTRARSSSTATLLDTSWFARNEWFRTTYYAVSDTASPASACVGPCLSVTNVAGSPRAILILMGRSLSNAPRPNGTAFDYLEFDNASFGASPRVFEQQTISRNPAAAKSPFNDRVIVVQPGP